MSVKLSRKTTRTTVARPRTDAPGRAKISVTIERPAYDAVRRLTSNVSGFVNEAVKDKLYFARVEEEIKQLEAEGVRPDPAARRWFRQVFKDARRRASRGR